MKKKILRVVGATLLLVLLCGGAGLAWAHHTAGELLGRVIEVPVEDFPVPYPLTTAELDALRAERADQVAEGEDPLAGVDLDALALERAVARGDHLVHARYACGECHGQDFSGGVMVDDPAMGRFLGPNLTAGEGGVGGVYTPSDWDRIVRHGVRRDGHPAVMPSEDFVRMSTRELSDIVAYLRSRPAVDNTVPETSLGPIGATLLATQQFVLSADRIEDHDAPRPEFPPEARPDAEFGQHLAAICTGCHRANLEGGPIAAGPPDWLPAANLTQHEDGLAGWTFEQFDTAMRQSVRPDGSALRDPMTRMQPYAERMTDVEMRALWAYLQTASAQPTGQ